MRIARADYRSTEKGKFIRHHVYSEFGGPWPGFLPQEREAFIKVMYSYADFACIEILAFAVGPNYFEILLDVPKKVKFSVAEIRERFKKFIAAESGIEGISQPDYSDKAQVESCRKRFANVGSFLKYLKLYATSRYHREHGTRGTLWSSRYIGMYVQRGFHSQYLAAWISHQGVRDGENDSVENSPYATFGRACMGDKRCRKMVCELFGTEKGGSPRWAQAKTAFLKFIEDETVEGKPLRTTKEGKPLLGRGEVMRTEVRHFRGGMAFGDAEFCKRLVEGNTVAFPSRVKISSVIAGQRDPRLRTIRYKGDLRSPRKRL